MPVHIGGQACEMDKIVALAGQHRLAIVEDAAHAFPTTAESASVTASERKSRMVGSIGHATAFSFYATKTIATGEGGMLTTDDDRMAERVRLMRLHGVSKDAWNRGASPLPSWYYEVLAPGLQIQSHRCRVRAWPGAIAARAGAAGPAGGDRPAIQCRVCRTGGA